MGGGVTQIEANPDYELKTTPIPELQRCSFKHTFGCTVLQKTLDPDIAPTEIVILTEALALTLTPCSPGSFVWISR